MEDEEKLHINNNQINLNQHTKIDGTNLIPHLKERHILGNDDVELLDPVAEPSAKAGKLYEMMTTRVNGYEAMLEALKATDQTEAFKLLNNLYTESVATGKKIKLDKDSQRLGDGVFSTVYPGAVVSARECVAVKTVSNRQYNLDDLRRKLDDLVKIDWHENVLRYYAFQMEGNDATAGTAWIVLEKLRGSTSSTLASNLDSWVESSPRNTGDQQKQNRVEVLRQITAGLAHLHSKNIVHSNLKPQNIFIVTEDRSNKIRVKVGDYGIPKEKDKDFYTKVNALFGFESEAWLAPEILKLLGQRESAKITFTKKSDIFSLGCIFYYVLSSGLHPFGPNPLTVTYLILNKLPDVNLNHIYFTDPSKVGIINRMIADQPTDRPTTEKILKNVIFRKTDPNDTKDDDQGEVTESNMGSTASNTTESFTNQTSGITIGAMPMPMPSQENAAEIKAKSRWLPNPFGKSAPIGFSVAPLCSEEGTVSHVFEAIRSRSLDVVKASCKSYSAKHPQVSLKDISSELDGVQWQTPLHIGVAHGNKAIVEYLLDTEGFKKLMSPKNYQQLLHGCVQNTKTLAEVDIQDKVSIIEMLVKAAKSSSKSKGDDAVVVDPDLNLDEVHPQLILELAKRGNLPDDKFGGANILNLAAHYMSPQKYHTFVVEALKKDPELATLTDTKQRLPIHDAVLKMEVQEATLALFAKSNVDFNAIDGDGNPVLFNAIQGGRSLSLIQSLINKGAKPYMEGAEGNTVLHCAAKHGNVEVLRNLVKKFPDLLDDTNDAGESVGDTAKKNEDKGATCLKIWEKAVADGSSQEPAKLESSTSTPSLQRQVSFQPEASIDEGTTPSHKKTGTLGKFRKSVGKLIDTLLFIGDDDDTDIWKNMTLEDVCTYDQPGLSPQKFHNILVQRINDGVAGTLKEKGATMLQNALVNNDVLVETMRIFVQQNVDINHKIKVFVQDSDTTDLDEPTVFNYFTWAVYKGRSEECLKALMELGTDHSFKDITEGHSALHLAAAKNYQVIPYLVSDLGQEVNGKNLNGNTPLHKAIKGTSRTQIHKAVSTLLELGADAVTLNHLGESPLTLAGSNRAVDPQTAQLVRRKCQVDIPQGLPPPMMSGSINLIGSGNSDLGFQLPFSNTGQNAAPLFSVMPDLGQGPPTQ